jgi:hypothetical protein
MRLIPKGGFVQTLTVNIQDNFVQDFLSIIEHYKGKIQIQKDKNLEYDPYFYERQNELRQIRKGIKNGDRQLISFDDLENKTSLFEKELERK